MDQQCQRRTTWIARRCKKIPCVVICRADEGATTLIRGRVGKGAISYTQAARTAAIEQHIVSGSFNYRASFTYVATMMAV